LNPHSNIKISGGGDDKYLGNVVGQGDYRLVGASGSSSMPAGYYSDNVAQNFPLNPEALSKLIFIYIYTKQFKITKNFFL
jgi:hypothetical protein